MSSKREIRVVSGKILRNERLIAAAERAETVTEIKKERIRSGRQRTENLPLLI